jgi:hypothetical protein
VRENLMLGAHTRLSRDAAGVEEDTERVLGMFPGYGSG